MREALEEKIEERREARERERERERKRKKFNERREKFNKILLFFLTSCYSAHLFIDVHCSKKLKKFRYASTAATCILVFWWS